MHLLNRYTSAPFAALLVGSILSGTPAVAQEKTPEVQSTPLNTPPSPSAWYPNWPVDRFGWVMQPIFAFKYTQGVDETTGTTKSTASEAGLAFGLTGIPVVAGNPGYTIGPRIGGAYGHSRSEVKSPTGEKSTTNLDYRRQWGGIDNTLYYKSFRYSLNLTRGELRDVKKGGKKIQSFRADNDFGILFRSWLSGHYSLSLSRAYQTGFYTPFLVENDHWLHTRIFTNFMGFMFDLGPGVTQVSAWDLQGDNKVGSGTVNYFLMQTQFTVFWKLIGEGIGKYAIHASEKRLGLYATERLPDEDLNEPTMLAMPEDSFLGSLFFGVKDIFFGVGAGWRYNIQILNVAEKGDSTRETTRNHGFGLYYEIRL